MTADLLPEDEWEVVEAPDGDPAKRGTITCTAPIIRGDGIRPELERDTRDTGRLERSSGLLVAPSLAGLYHDDRSAREAMEALRDSTRGQTR